MVIEWLKFVVKPELRERYIQADEEIWTATLAEYPGFLGKEVWIDPTKPGEVVLMIRWVDRESWKAVPVDRLEATERRFADFLGTGVYQMTERGEFQVRKFPQPKSTI